MNRRQVMRCMHDSKRSMATLSAAVIVIATLAVPGAVMPQEQAPATGPAACRSFQESEDVPGCEVPAEYKDKRMPEGGWTNPKMIAAGEVIFQAICAVCHGPEGKPKLVGARNFKDPKKINTIPDYYWFWRISEGVAGTKMPPWKGALTEEQRWQAMAYEHRFSHDVKAEVHAHPEMDAAAKK